MKNRGREEERNKEKVRGTKGTIRARKGEAKEKLCYGGEGSETLEIKH